MDIQQAIALVLVAAAVFFLVRRFIRGPSRSKSPRCADCAAASMHAADNRKQRSTQE